MRFKILTDWINKKVQQRMENPPDLTIHNAQSEIYMERWFVWHWWGFSLLRWLPRVYLHVYSTGDSGSPFHDHPYLSLSFMLSGQLLERTFLGLKSIPSGSIVYRNSQMFHIIEGASPGATALFITGFRFSSWGFLVQQDGHLIRKSYKAHMWDQGTENKTKTGKPYSS